MREGRILNYESATQPHILRRPREESDVQPWTNGHSEKSWNGNSEHKSGSPIGIRVLSERFESQNNRYPSPPSPKRSRSASRSPLRARITSQSSHSHGRSPTTPISISDYGKRQPREVAEQADSSSIPHHSSAHASPEVCDANIASIIYSSPSEGKRITPCRRKIPKMSFFPCFGSRKRKPECWMEKKKGAFWSSEAKEGERLRKEEAWKKVKEGKHGKSALERQIEWNKGLREYEECSSWQRHVGQDIRKRHQDKLIKAAVREKPISDIQELRSDALMMENELFGTSKNMDEYKTKTRKILNVFDARRQSQREKEILRTEDPKKNQWRGFSLANARGKLKEFLPRKTSSLSQLWGGKDSPRSSTESMPATPCNCRKKEIRPMCPLRDEKMKTDKEDSSFQNKKEVTSNRPRKLTYKPNLKRIKPSYRDKRTALGWNHKWPPEDPEESWHDHDQQISTPRPHRHNFYSKNAKKFRRHSTKAQIIDDHELDEDEWSIIDLESSPKLPNPFKCFG